MRRGRNLLQTRTRLSGRMLRISLILLAVTAVFAQTPAPRGNGAAGAKPGSIRGVVAGASGEPLRKAEVTLRSLGAGGGFAGGGSMRGPMSMTGREGGMWMATTDASGAFVFDNIPPGQYSVTVQRTGYVRQDFGSRSRTSNAIQLREGQQYTGMSIKLVPHGVVAGRVLDEDGDPVMHASVQVLRERWIGTRRQMTPQNGDATNDLGEYRLSGLMPGRYFLMVAFNRPEPPNRPRPEGAGSDLSYASVFYPGVTELAQATPIQITAGQEMRGVDLQLRKTATFRARGRVIDESGKPAMGVGVMAMPSDGLFVGMRGMGTVRNEEGAFEIPGLSPGSYTLVANRMGREETRTVGRLPVQVGNRDLEGLVLQMQHTFEINGTVKVPEGGSIAGARVIAESMETGLPFQATLGGAVDAAGTWKIPGVSPGKFRIYISPTPAGTYIKSVLVQGQDITAGADISAAAGGIDILLAPKAPDVTGTVTGSEKEPLGGATVVLVPESSRRNQFWLFRTATTDQNGAFSIKGIVPGSYTAHAFREIEDGSWYSPDVLKSIEGNGAPVKLAEGSAETVQLTAAQ